MSAKIRLWVTIGILGLLALFTLQNIVTVQVTFLFWTMEMPRAVLLFVVFVLGAALGLIVKSMRGSAAPHR